MAAKIRVLKDDVINKIAAGEVIENPASVVKELVENSLDAGATDITVEVKGGGQQLIRITDNGCGMNRDDTLLSIERHATSKIKNIDDLHDLYTMGFRGEAIASIASISKFTLLTAPEKGEGTCLFVDGGKQVKCSSTVRDPGTTIDIRSLFFNVPVRKKFQRSPAHDNNEIFKIVSLQALANPHVKFELIRDQATVILAPIPTGDEPWRDRNERILGNDFSRQTLPFTAKSDNFDIKGVVGAPSFTRHNRTGQYLFINKRAVVSPMISRAVKEGFGTLLPYQRHPVFALFIEMPGALVDVNVHPQKKEVRLREEEELQQLISDGVTRALQSKPKPILSPSFIPAVVPTFSIEIEEEEEEIKLPDDGHLFCAEEKIQQECRETQIMFSDKWKPQPSIIGTIPGYLILDPQSTDLIPGRDTIENGLYLVHQRRAHQRILFERWQKVVEEPLAERLISPETLEYSPGIAALIQENLKTLENIGFCLKEFGPHSFLLEEIPYGVRDHNYKELLEGLVEDLKDYPIVKDPKEAEKGWVKAVQRAAFPMTKTLETSQASFLIEQLWQCKTPHYCPQGKPTWTFLNPDQIAKLFKESPCLALND